MCNSINLRLKFFIVFLLFFSYNHFGNFNLCFLIFNFVFGALFFTENITLWWFKGKSGYFSRYIMKCNILNLPLSTALLFCVVYVICFVHISDFLTNLWDNDIGLPTMFLNFAIIYLLFKNPVENFKRKGIF
jgi:hypothetical protein